MRGARCDAHPYWSLSVSGLTYRAPAANRPFNRVLTVRKAASAAHISEESFAFKPRKRADWQVGPSFQLTREQAVQTQLQVCSTKLQSVFDVHGSLNMAQYRRLCNATTRLSQITELKFCIGLATLTRSQEAIILGKVVTHVCMGFYWELTPTSYVLPCSVNRDLGQFERFRRIFHSPHYSILLGHIEHVPLSSLKVYLMSFDIRYHDVAAIQTQVLCNRSLSCSGSSESGSRATRQERRVYLNSRWCSALGADMMVYGSQIS